jgi:hypothetical protein
MSKFLPVPRLALHADYRMERGLIACLGQLVTINRQEAQTRTQMAFHFL